MVNRPISLSLLASRAFTIENQSGAWHAEAVDQAVIRKLEKIKTLQGFKNSTDGGQGEICHG